MTGKSFRHPEHPGHATDSDTPPPAASRRTGYGSYGMAVGALPADATDELVIALWLKGKSPETQRAYQADVAAFRAATGVPLHAVTLVHLHAFADALIGLEDASVRRRMTAIKSLLSFATKTGYLPFNVGAAFQSPRLADDLAERILTEEQVQRLLVLERDPRNHALLRVLYTAGLRVSELVTLRWGLIHEREGGRAQLTIHGKGGRTRHVVITAATWDELQALRSDALDDAPVFVSRGANGRSGGGPLDVSQARRIVAAAARRAGIPGKVSPHWLRHAHASHALDRGAPIHLVRSTLGHGSLAVTGRYTHARPAASSADYLAM